MAATLPVLSVDLYQAARKSESFLAGESEPVIQAAEERYRKFLQLVLKYPDMPLAPSRDVDEMWHLHMLHPRAYHADCLRLFGDILDHDGGFGLGEGELPALNNLFSETANLWQQEYGEPYVEDLSDAICREDLTAAKRSVTCKKGCEKE